MEEMSTFITISIHCVVQLSTVKGHWWRYVWDQLSSGCELCWTVGWPDRRAGRNGDRNGGVIHSLTCGTQVTTLLTLSKYVLVHLLFICKSTDPFHLFKEQSMLFICWYSPVFSKCMSLCRLGLNVHLWNSY